MRFVAVLAIFALWGCSKDSPKSGSCPEAVVKLFQKAIQGEGLDMNDANEIQSSLPKGSNEDDEACTNILLNDKKAWIFVHGGDGSTKMAQFERLSGDEKKTAGNKFVQEFITKAILDGVKKGQRQL